jgi:CRP-like cAMP-binding protein
MDLFDLVGEIETSTPAASGAQFVAFADWSSEDLAALRGLGRLEIVRAGAEAIRVGDTDRDLFVVASGELEVLRAAAGAHAPVARLGPSDVFGEMSFIDDSPRSATVRALTESRLVRISPEDLDELAEREPRLAIAFLREVARILSNRLRNAS